MPGAGNYSTRFQLLSCTRSTPTSTGDRPKTYTAGGYLWGSIDVQSATEETDRGAVRHTAYGTVRIRQYPTLSVLDRLSLPDIDETYEIEGITFGDNETVCQVRRIETT